MGSVIRAVAKDFARGNAVLVRFPQREKQVAVRSLSALNSAVCFPTVSVGGNSLADSAKIVIGN